MRLKGRFDARDLSSKEKAARVALEDPQVIEAEGAKSSKASRKDVDVF